MPDYAAYLAAVKGKSAEGIVQEYERQLAAWNSMVALADSSPANGAPRRAAPDFDDSGWQTMPLPGMWEGAALPSFDGVVWLRCTVDIPAALAGRELLLSLAEVDDNDITYFNGVQVGSTEGYNLSRRYKVPAKLVKRGRNVIALRVTDTGGGGGVYGSAADLSLSAAAKGGKPQGEKISLAADWRYRATVDFGKLPPRPQSPLSASNPSTLYNGMIYPLVPFAIKGAIWYQGEANASRAGQYRDLFPLMVQDWRRQWNADFPFYFVQLAGFAAQPANEDWAMLREAQLHALHLANTGMAVATDVGDAQDIHPKNKQAVGTRLALLARANTYGQKLAAHSPLYRDYRVEGSAIRISFSHADGGLRSKGGAQLRGFTIAGADHVFHEATATIAGDEVVVSSPQVVRPLAVRYAWENNPDYANLCNAAGLPASPFRTDTND
jgi:sialate O-acetylesterase